MTTIAQLLSDLGKYGQKKVFAFTEIQNDVWKRDGVSGGRFVHNLRGEYLAVNGEKQESDIYTGQKASKFHSQTRHGNFSQLDSEARQQEDYKKKSDQEVVVYTKYCDAHGRPVPFGQRVVNGELVVADEHGNVREIDTDYFDQRIAEKAAREARIQVFVDKCVIDDTATMQLFGLTRAKYDMIFGGFDSQDQDAYEKWSYAAGYLGAHVANNKIAAADCRTSSFMMKHASTTYDSWDVLKIRALCEALSRSSMFSSSKKNLEAYRTEDPEVTESRRTRQEKSGIYNPENVVSGTRPAEITYDHRGSLSKKTLNLIAQEQLEAAAASGS